MTNVEWRLWSRLRGRQLGLRFRRQHPIGPYVADFACLAVHLVVELDGDTHTEAYDLHRDGWLEARGWRVLHFSVQEVDEGFEDVVDQIEFELASPPGRARSASRADLPAERGGELTSRAGC